jgi:hypothetical protein
MNAIQEGLAICVFALGLPSAVGGWLYAHKELLAIQSLRLDVFLHGPVVLTFAAPDLVPPPQPDPQRATRTRRGRFRVLSNGAVLFAPSVALPLPILSLANLFAFKGSIAPAHGAGRVRVRAATGSTVALLSLGIAVFGIYLVPSLQCRLGDVTYPPGAWQCRLGGAGILALLASFAWLRVFVIRRRARSLVNEIREAMPRLYGTSAPRRAAG